MSTNEKEFEYWRQQTEADLRAKLPSRFADVLVGLFKPAIHIRTRPASDDSIRVGSSKIGGEPDLPVGTEWPGGSEPMVFLGQFRLEELAAYDLEGVLPKRGVLSFFQPFETDGQGVVLHLPETGLVRTNRPVDHSVWGRFKEWRNKRVITTLPAAAVSFQGKFNFPAADGPEVARVLSEDDVEDLSDRIMEKDLFGAFWDAHFLGYPRTIADDSQYLAAKASEPWLDEEALEVKAREWRLLLQLSDEEDGGVFEAFEGVCFLIRGEDLSRGDFSRVFAVES